VSGEYRAIIVHGFDGQEMGVMVHEIENFTYISETERTQRKNPNEITIIRAKAGNFFVTETPREVHDLINKCHISLGVKP
jgi:chemotaxis signal transduction protein